MIVKIVGGHGGVSPGYRATSYLIDGKLLIDAGSVASGIPIAEQAQIDNILISHSHLDHISDLAFLADNCFGMKGKPFEIWTNNEVKTNVMTHLLNDAIWPDFTKLPTASEPTLRFNTFESGSDFGEIDELYCFYRYPKSKLNYKFGVGYFHKRWITPAYFITQGNLTFEYQGIALTTSLELGNMNIEFKKYLELPIFSALESYLYAISVNKSISLDKEQKKTPKTPSFLDNLYPFVSLRIQPVKYYFTKNQDLFNKSRHPSD